MEQETCILFYPNVSKRDVFEIKMILKRIGRIMGECVVDSVTNDQISAHCNSLEDEPRYQELTERFVGRKVIVLKVHGENIIQKVRDATSGRPVLASDTEKGAKQEIDTWFHPGRLAFEKTAQMAATK